MARTKFLIAGTGAVVKKMASVWEFYADKGVELYAADISDDPVGREALPPGTVFFNWKNPADLDKLVASGRDQPFDYAYLSAFPTVHLATALRLDFIVKTFLIPKPVDSHFNLMQTLHSEHLHNGSLNIAQRSYVHDHYRNKALTKFLRGHIADLHRRNGFLKNVRIYITEHQSINDEIDRRLSLECGMILDLGPHALSVAYEIIPETLEWVDAAGHRYRRTSRRFEIQSAIRARDNLCMLHTLEAETFSTIHLRVFEDIEFTPRNKTQVHDKITDRPFDLLVVVGKGVSIADRSEGRDLKAIEMEFDGQMIRGNFDTNEISGVIDKEIQRTLEKKVDRRHRGLSLPLQELGANGFSMEELDKTESLVPPFQSFDDAFSIASLLEGCRHHHTATRLLNYATGMTVTDIINRSVAKGLDSRWALDEDLTGLIFGEVPAEAIP